MTLLGCLFLCHAVLLGTGVLHKGLKSNFVVVIALHNNMHIDATVATLVVHVA